MGSRKTQRFEINSCLETVGSVEIKVRLEVKSLDGVTPRSELSEFHTAINSIFYQNTPHHDAVLPEPKF